MHLPIHLKLEYIYQPCYNDHYQHKHGLLAWLMKYRKQWQYPIPFRGDSWLFIRCNHIIMSITSSASLPLGGISVVRLSTLPCIRVYTHRSTCPPQTQIPWPCPLGSDPQSCQPADTSFQLIHNVTKSTRLFWSLSTTCQFLVTDEQLRQHCLHLCDNSVIITSPKSHLAYTWTHSGVLGDLNPWPQVTWQGDPPTSVDKTLSGTVTPGCSRVDR